MRGVKNQVKFYAETCSFSLWYTQHLRSLARIWSRTFKFQELPSEYQKLFFLGRSQLSHVSPELPNEPRSILSRAWIRSESGNNHTHISDLVLACLCFKVGLSLQEPARQWLLSLLSPIPTLAKKKSPPLITLPVLCCYCALRHKATTLEQNLWLKHSIMLSLLYNLDHDAK